MGRWRNWKRASFAWRRLRVRLPLGPPLADVAQLAEARRSDRRQCRFESDRQYRVPEHARLEEDKYAQSPECGYFARTYRTEVHTLERRPLDVAQWERTGPGSRRLGVRVSPSRPPMRGSATGTTPGPDPGDPRSNRGLAPHDDALQPSRPDAQVGVPSIVNREVGSSSLPARTPCRA
jgi:hypothetical protein